MHCASGRLKQYVLQDIGSENQAVVRSLKVLIAGSLNELSTVKSASVKNPRLTEAISALAACGDLCKGTSMKQEILTGG
jgi:hypothetical protein